MEMNPPVAGSESRAAMWIRPVVGSSVPPTNLRPPANPVVLRLRFDVREDDTPVTNQ
jgi:hypothetical protein